jgi:hypothetical protein
MALPSFTSLNGVPLVVSQIIMLPSFDPLARFPLLSSFRQFTRSVCWRLNILYVLVDMVHTMMSPESSPA